MKKHIIVFSFFIFSITLFFSDESADKGISQNFSGGIGCGNEIAFFEHTFQPSLYDYYYERKTLPVTFFNLIIKFDYLFLKEVNYKYKIGLGLSIGDNVTLGGLIPSYMYLITLYNLAPYTFSNRVFQKIMLVNVFGIEYFRKFLIFEIGINVSFAVFYAYYDAEEYYYYLTSFVSPYLFLGFWEIKDYIYAKNISHIIGGFLELSFDVSKYATDNYSAMKSVYCYFSFGFEYRIGYTKKN